MKTIKTSSYIFKMSQRGPFFEDPMQDPYLKPPQECHCGSGKNRFPLTDARGIFVDYVCDDCEEKVKSKYRPEIFTDSNYYTDEPIDEVW